MKEPVLTILAAGMGSRYGGLKQIDVVGNNGESMIDFSIYDAYQAGFKKVILIIKKEHETAFEQSLGHKLRRFMEVEYSYQELTDIPEGFVIDPNRVKPWGTTHALLTLKDKVDGPFMIINADDYYGKDSFKQMYKFLTTEVSDDNYGMVAYTLNNTLSDSGSVTRAICETDDGYLTKITEVKQIERKDGVIKFSNDDGKTWETVDGNLPSSMNYWGFTPRIFKQCEQIFTKFLTENLTKDPLKCEHVIPTAVGDIIAAKEGKVKVMTSKDRWFGVTYQADKPHVQEQFLKYKEAGLYPFDLWEVK